MKMPEIRKRADAVGVTLKTGKKAELIRAIQTDEKNPACFRTGRVECYESECWWKKDCMSGSSRDRKRGG